MSTHDDDVAVAADAHGTHAEPALNEPPTPGWVPLLGAVLALCGAIAFVATRGPGEKEADLTARAHALAQQRIEAKKAAEAPAAAPAPAPAPMPAAPMGAGKGG